MAEVVHMLITLNLHWQQRGYLFRKDNTALCLSLWHLGVGILELGGSVIGIVSCSLGTGPVVSGFAVSGSIL